MSMHRSLTLKGLILASGCIFVQGDSLSGRPTLVDLSYRHNLDAGDVVQAIPTRGDLTVDVSSSALGDEGLKIVSDKCFELSSSTISLLARSNGVSMGGATELLNRLLSTSNSTTSPTFDTLDLSWNYLDDEAGTVRSRKSFHRALENLFCDAAVCPSSVNLQRCALNPSSVRAIGKGLLKRYSQSFDSKPLTAKTLSLSLCGNTAVGDSGTAAIAAAIRSIATSEEAQKLKEPIFDVLDLSGCEITDAGAEALAFALESSDRCLIRKLDLSNNRITERGVETLARGLATAEMNRETSDPLLPCLDLSNNQVGDAGASILASCLIERQIVSRLTLRSCHICADGAASFGHALRRVAVTGIQDSSSSSPSLHLDLSGNLFGILRGKGKKSGKYSASHLKSKASATAASYMNQGFSFIKKGLQDVGVDLGPASGESDDEEEARTGSTILDGEIDPARARCGGKALSMAFTDAEGSKLEKEGSPRPSFWIGLRACHFDHAAADALANLLVVAQDDLGVEIELDTNMNDVLEEDMQSALRGHDEDLLREMAERHAEKINAIKEAERRSREASKARASWDYEDDDEVYNDDDDAFGDFAPMDDQDDATGWDSDEEYDDGWE